MADPLASITNRKTPQRLQIPGRTDQVRNNAGGMVFAKDEWDRFMSFLILGSEGGTYYVTEAKLTQENVKLLFDLLPKDGKRVVDVIVDVSLNGRAYRQQPTLFSLAAAASYGIHLTQKDDGFDDAVAVRKYALSKVNSICRTGTMFFQFLQYCTQFRGRGSALNKAVQDWYLAKTPAQLATQIVKYNQREGWSHRDMLRLAKPKIGANHPNHQIVAWLTGKGIEPSEPLIEGMLKAKHLSGKSLTDVITQYKLPMEAIPTEHMKNTAVWEALVPHMGLTAVLRNLGRMGANGMVHHSNLAKLVRDRLKDTEGYVKARVHPMQVLLALATYQVGHGVKGSLMWKPVPTVVDQLDDAFYASFGSLEITNMRRLVGLDISGSMTQHMLMGTHLNCRTAEAALALTVLHQDPDSRVMGFTDGKWPSIWNSGANRHWGNNIGSDMTELNFSSKMRISDAMLEIQQYEMGGTNCAVPMLWALENNVEVDSFEIYTDNETWHGDIHPVQALKQYREATGINAKLIVVGMTATPFSIADPTDGNSLDVVGFDASAPSIVSNFIMS